LPLGAAVDRFWTSRLSWAAPLSMVGDLANAISRGWLPWCFGRCS
jgi:hypothetical protein